MGLSPKRPTPLWFGFVTVGLRAHPKDRGFYQARHGFSHFDSLTTSATFVENRITLDQLKAADEVILLGTTIEVLPVVTVDRTKVRDGTPGPVTRQLQEAFRLSVARWLAPVTV